MLQNSDSQKKTTDKNFHLHGVPPQIYTLYNTSLYEQPECISMLLQGRDMEGEWVMYSHKCLPLHAVAMVSTICSEQPHGPSRICVLFLV